MCTQVGKLCCVDVHSFQHDTMLQRLYLDLSLTSQAYKGEHLCCPGTLDNVLQISLLLLESLNLQQVKLDREGAGNFHWEAVVLIFPQVLALQSSCCVYIWHWTDFAILHSSKWYGRRQKLVILGPMLGQVKRTDQHLWCNILGRI